MINTDLGNNKLGNTWGGLPVCDEQSPIATKKVALRDVQDDGRSLIHNDPELGKRRVQEMAYQKSDFLKLRKFFHNHPELPQLYPEEEDSNASSISASAPTPTASVIMLSPDRPSVPVSLEMPCNGLPVAESEPLQLTSESEVPHSADSKGTIDKERNDQLLHLQNPQKHCYEYDQRDGVDKFGCLSTVELSICAVESDKRSIQHSVEEAAKKAIGIRQIHHPKSPCRTEKAPAANQTKNNKFGKAIRTRASGRLREYVPVKKDPSKRKLVFDLTGDSAGPRIPGAGALCSWGPPSRGIKFRIAPPDYDPTAKKNDGKDSPCN